MLGDIDGGPRGGKGNLMAGVNGGGMSAASSERSGEDESKEGVGCLTKGLTNLLGLVS